MPWILLAAILSSAPQPRVTEVLPTDAAACIAVEAQTGSLIVSRGDCLAVKVFTQSPYTHVAAVVMRRGQPYVYDSANGAGVRCQTLANYLCSQNPAEVHVFQPREPLSKRRAEQFEQHLDSQLGRPYAIKHHLTGNRAEGVHCAEYVTDALIACDLLTAREPSRVSPASLVQGIVKSELYAAALKVKLNEASGQSSAGDEGSGAGQGWCRTMWGDTKQCTRNCYLRLRGLFCCY